MVPQNIEFSFFEMRDSVDTLGMGRFFNRTKVPGKMMLSLHLAGLAAVLAVLFRTPDRIMCAFAMLFSSCGDYMLIDELENHRQSKKFKNTFVTGGVFFAVAHVLYILTFFWLLQKAESTVTVMNIGSYIAIGIAVALILLFIVICGKKRDFSKFPLFFAYVLLLTADRYAALTYGAAEFNARPLSLLASAGAVSFMISDLILGLDVIGGIKKFAPYLWWFYPIGQLFMIIAA